MKAEVILELGGELGSVTLFGGQVDRGWRFWIETVDQSAAMLDDEDLKGPPLFGRRELRHSTERVDYWEEALALLNKYPWHLLHPVFVHPEFAQRIWTAVQQRFERDHLTSHRRAKQALTDWRDRCGSSLE